MCESRLGVVRLIRRIIVKMKSVYCPEQFGIIVKERLKVEN